MVAAVAIEEPHTAPNRALAPMVAMARPPLRCPMKAATRLYRLCDSPVRPANTPIMTNSGTTDRLTGKTASKGERPSTKARLDQP